jgi:predicted HicB family RNase H-like nuclease
MLLSARIPTALGHAAKVAAARRGVTLRALVAQALAREIGWTDTTRGQRKAVRR